MNCPKCGSQDFYSGLMGDDCINAKCSNFKNGTLSSGIIKPVSTGPETNPMPPHVGEPHPDFPGFRYFEPRSICSYTSDFYVLVWEQNPELKVVYHNDPNEYFAGPYLTPGPGGGTKATLYASYAEGETPQKACEEYVRRNGNPP